MTSKREASVRRLESYACDEWVAGDAAGSTCVDAATGSPVAIVDASGLDMARMLNYGRERGGPALRAMSFHQRALMLKAIGQALLTDKECLYAESFPTGATRTDAWIDIEGGISTLLSYGSKGRRELPNAHTLIDGSTESLSRDGSFSALHLLSSLEGVAVHINAFNFPCWGLLEKLAPSWLAGVPVIIKPARQTAYLAELLVRRIVATGQVPDGALQLISGSVGDLLGHVGAQDVVTFTGSSAVGHTLRSHPRIVQQSTRFTMEADSLNCAILGDAAGPGSVEFDLFVREVFREMTSKAGQKCTAIRRVMVPRQHTDALLAALQERLDTVVVGDPRDPRSRMGPLASLAQRDEVRERITRLATEAEVVSGNPAQVRLASGDGDAGAFMNPVLLYCDRPLAATEVHEQEAFGPVATILPYDTRDEAIELARRGGGSLVASVYTDDADFAREATLGLAPWHGRVMLGNRRSAKSSTGHGSPLPMLVHGGPGRAGGGEELGGIRAVHHYLQRTAVQGPPGLLASVAGQWVPGASSTEADVHPFRKSLAELQPGDSIVTAAREITLADIEHFATFTGDNFYAHMDDEAARANPFFEGRVAHGYLVVSFAAGLFVDPAPGPVLANYGVDNLRFVTPVNAGDSVQVTLVCKAINPRETENYGEVRWDCVVTNQDAAVVAHYDVLTLVAKQWDPAG